MFVWFFCCFFSLHSKSLVVLEKRNAFQIERLYHSKRRCKSVWFHCSTNVTTRFVEFAVVSLFHHEYRLWKMTQQQRALWEISMRTKSKPYGRVLAKVYGSMRKNLISRRETVEQMESKIVTSNFEKVVYRWKINYWRMRPKSNAKFVYQQSRPIRTVLHTEHADVPKILVTCAVE